MSVAEINALLYSPQHPRDRLERASQIAALSPGWRASFVALLDSRSDGNAGLAPASAARPAAPGFRPLKVTAIDQESADVVSLTMQDPDPAAKPLPDSAAGPVCRAASSTERQRRAALSQLFAFRARLDGPLSDQREDRTERRGGRLCEGQRAGRRQSSTSARRAGRSSCSRAKGLSRSSARESGRRPSLQCSTRCRRRVRHARCCGCTPRVTESTFRSPPRFAASSRVWRTAAAMSASAGPTTPTGSERTSTPRATSRGRCSPRWA